MTAILNEESLSISQVTPTAPPGMQRVVHRCLETDPEQRFQSSHDLAFALEALSDSTITTPSGSHAQQGKGRSRRRIAILGTALLVLIVASTLAYLWLRREPVPKDSNYVQLTHDGHPKELVGTDGPRLYLALGKYGSRSVGVIPISGGEPTKIPAASASMRAIDLSPDGSQILVGNAGAINGHSESHASKSCSPPVMLASTGLDLRRKGQRRPAAQCPVHTIPSFHKKSNKDVAPGWLLKYGSGLVALRPQPVRLPRHRRGRR